MIHQINTQTLQVAIQAIAAEQRRLIVAAESEEVLWILVHDCDRALVDLMEAYDEAAKTIINLVPWDRLTQQQEQQGPQGT